MDDKLLAALIGGGASLLGVVVGLVFNPITQRRLQELKAAQDEEMAKLRARLDESSGERKAQRDYEYEARKRLYADVQPLMIQIALACEATFSRMANLAQTAQRGDLGTGPRSWLIADPYYIASTVHRLLLPGACFQLLRDKTTELDFQLDPKIATLYRLLRTSYLALTKEFEFAAAEPKLEYSPYAGDAEARAGDDPARFLRQGVATGNVDNALAAMIVAQEGKNHRVLRVGELQVGMEKRSGEIRRTLEEFFWIVRGFHPLERPVLWRIMCAQACLAYVGWNAQLADAGHDDLARAVSAFCRDPRTARRFATSPGDAGLEDARLTFRAVESVLVRELSRRDLLDPL